MTREQKRLPPGWAFSSLVHNGGTLYIQTFGWNRRRSRLLALLIRAGRIKD